MKPKTKTKSIEESPGLNNPQQDMTSHARVMTIACFSKTYVKLHRIQYNCF